MGEEGGGGDGVFDRRKAEKSGNFAVERAGNATDCRQTGCSSFHSLALVSASRNESLHGKGIPEEQDADAEQANEKPAS